MRLRLGLLVHDLACRFQNIGLTCKFHFYNMDKTYEVIAKPSYCMTCKTVFRLLTDFVCLYNYEFWLSLCKIVRSSVILLLPLFIN